MLNFTKPPTHLDSAPKTLNETFQQIIRQINAGTTRFEILSVAFDVLRLIVPFDRMSVALLNDAGTYVRLHWVNSSIPSQHLRRDFTAPVSTCLRSILACGTPRIIDDLEPFSKENPDSLLFRLAVRDGIRSVLVFPLVLQSKAIGVIYFSSLQRDTYTRYHAELFSEISEELAVLVEQCRLRQVQAEAQSQDQLLSVIVHDLRSSASAIQGFLNLVRDTDWFPKLDSNSQGIFDILDRNTGSILGLLEDLSDSNQLNLGELSLMPVAVDIDAFLTEFNSDAAFFAKGKDIHFTIKRSPNLPHTADFDPVRIRQVLWNLLTNAVKFSWPKTEVSLEVKASGARLIFAMIDHGQGIPCSEQSKLFHRFGCSSVKPTANESTSGLGLYIVKNLVERHGGGVALESVVDVGSRFSFWLPLMT